MIGVGAVTEVQAKDVDAGAKELADHLLAGAGGAERGYDLGFSLASHGAASTQDLLPADSILFRAIGVRDQDGAEVVDVGEGGAGSNQVAEPADNAAAVVVRPHPPGVASGAGVASTPPLAPEAAP